VLQIRPIEIADATPIAALYAANREFLMPWEPRRDEAFFTPAGQRARIEGMHADPGSYNCVIEEDGAPLGMISLTAIVRGPAQSGNLGYWVAKSANGRGVATRVTALMLDRAFGELGLHRVQAGTLLHNLGSQTVLKRNGFEEIGVARSYLLIEGRWQDMMLFQRVAQ
jgi:ribosomal-protein-alanine N-acetyltransferase